MWEEVRRIEAGTSRREYMAPDGSRVRELLVTCNRCGVTLLYTLTDVATGEVLQSYFDNKTGLNHLDNGYMACTPCLFKITEEQDRQRQNPH